MEWFRRMTDVLAFCSFYAAKLGPGGARVARYACIVRQLLCRSNLRFVVDGLSIHS